MDVLSIKNLQKRFGDKEILCGLDLSIPEHSIFGFVGRNGAGKTTTMKSILGLLKVDAGEIFVLGEKVVYGQTSTNRHIGYLPDVPEFYSFMTPREYLKLCGESMGMDKRDTEKRSEELLLLVGLSEEKRRIKGFSRGMKQRLGIAQALLSSPRLLICDEPTSALDPIGRKEILDLLYSVKDQTTVLFSTHILSDVERICTDVALLHNGKIVKQGPVGEIKLACQNEDFKVELSSENYAIKLKNAFPDARISQSDTLVFTGGEDLMLDVLGYIAENKISIKKIERIEMSLESLFVEVINS